MATYVPSHPALFEVVFGSTKAFSSFLKAKKAFDAGSIIARIQGVRTATKSYLTVQCGPSGNDHLELDTDLRYSNHSCEPNTAWDMSSLDPVDWHVYALRRIEENESLTFFYPSTEWDMEQPFVCNCGAPTCLKLIHGAKSLSVAELKSRGFVSPWILRLVRERDDVQNVENGEIDGPNDPAAEKTGTTADRK